MANHILFISSGIITYAMTIGKLPFFTAFKDEYQRKRMLEQIQKGLSGYHDREMRILSAGISRLLIVNQMNKENGYITHLTNTLFWTCTSLDINRVKVNYLDET